MDKRKRKPFIVLLPFQSIIFHAFIAQSNMPEMDIVQSDTDCNQTDQTHTTKLHDYGC